MLLETIAGLHHRGYPTPVPPARRARNGAGTHAAEKAVGIVWRRF
jgi:hypothetical protein